jgi:hypothetical protein
MFTVTASLGPRLYRESCAFPENDPSQYLGSLELGHPPTWSKVSFVIHCTVNPAGAPVIPAVTTISMLAAVLSPHAIVGVDTLFFGGAAGTRSPQQDASVEIPRRSTYDQLRIMQLL